MSENGDWVRRVERRMQRFALTHGHAYKQSDRTIAAAFEIGCFLCLVQFYEDQGFVVAPENLNEEGEYRYLTSPNGNPENFSWIKLRHSSDEFELRQQVRIRSHHDGDITFTPDMVVLRGGSTVEPRNDAEYAGGKRRMFSVKSADVIAAHECKSLNPFPELLVSFLGMLVASHAWLDQPNDRSLISGRGIHLAPTLFVGGTARALHVRMVSALRRTFPLNIILGLHHGTWEFRDHDKLTLIETPIHNPVVPSPTVETRSSELRCRARKPS